MKPRLLRQGSVSLEAALLLPILTTLVMGVFEWGQVLNREAHLQEIATDAVMVGARASSLQTSTASSWVSEQLQSDGFDAPHAQVQAVIQTSSAGQVLNLQISVPYQTLFGTVRTPVNLQASAVMRLEHQ